ncbi:RagB/SusD family nutrient uptake outer membrane protein [Sphingobacterium multivorum]|uniref:RagB/SusD family nutrient uptake outer membrane protein n=1 Tax=Sphingobacterium multivorum TaxID=28454 RepID=A0ABX7CM01_SPHMU|nr:RagB/SusD family nutrient uptake outer membrane protein [Sphingobacterium multivorum]QQT53052.1 RagB/SusD family nutrient uptake outer membrane protein [Sphingobacterium multivorum]
MRKYILLMGLVGTLILNACNKFLDVLPRTQIPEDNLFNTEQGFKDALTGVYISAKSNATYGKSLTFGTIENLVSSWDVTTNTLEQQLGLFNYGDSRVIDQFNAIFSQQYATIAAINSILQNLETNKSVFKTEGMYQIIKAECLGLRAYIHLDLMRLYGPMPTAPNIGNQLAYVTEFNREIHTSISYEEYRNKIFTDLQQAGELIKNYDPMLSYSMNDIRNPNGVGSNYKPQDDFLSYRNMRMNYYAIKALEARAYLWYGNKDSAYTSAKEVIDAKDSNGDIKFKLATGKEFTAANFSLTTEQIFGLYAFDLATTYTNFFGNATYRKGTSSTTVTNQLYGNTGTDFRESSLWNVITLSNGSKYNVIRKFWVTADNVTVLTDYKQLPMLRTSELYLILAETAPFSEGIEYLKTFRANRNIAGLAIPSDIPTLQNEIVKEYRKEFYGEGQAFYAYKRLNIPKLQVLFAPSSATVNYVLPMPTVESTN